MKDAVDDLSPLARREQLGAADEQRLEELLQSSEEARLFHELGRRFDAEDPAPPVPDAASQALVDTVLKDLQRGAQPQRRKLPRTAWLIAAAALLAASFAGAVIGVEQLRGTAAPTPSAVLPPVASASSKPTGSRVLPLAELPVAPSSPPAEPLPSADAPQPRAVPSSAAEVLSAAGRARRTGQAAQALELLQTLRSRYPQSPEASASEITLGKLQLERGAAAPALAHFDGYLKRAPGGALAPEALWGRAQALSQLGRGGEARKSLSDLLQRYPDSPYASAARAKLGTAPARP